VLPEAYERLAAASGLVHYLLDCPSEGPLGPSSFCLENRLREVLETVQHAMFSSDWFDASRLLDRTGLRYADRIPGSSIGNSQSEAPVRQVAALHWLERQVGQGRHAKDLAVGLSRGY